MPKCFDFVITMAYNKLMYNFNKYVYLLKFGVQRLLAQLALLQAKSMFRLFVH